MSSLRRVVAMAIVIACAVIALGDVVIETVTVGNLGNAPDTRYADPGFGGVDYVYEIGKYEITAEQYCEFLNAVAATDTYGLYNLSMWTDDYGCMIQRFGSPGDYTYGVLPDWAHRPVNYVSWADAARFCNWLSNGQPSGTQSLGTTEDGTYYLNGAATVPQLATIDRDTRATWVIPTENEWYKAAYYEFNATDVGYYDYATASNTRPSNELMEPDPGNNATFRDGGFTIGGPYFRTEVGSHEESASPYGTFDQGGNVWEWNETVLNEVSRGKRGGSFEDTYGDMHAMSRSPANPLSEAFDHGFRIAWVGTTNLGDMNCDGVVSAADIDPFVLALTDPPAYIAQFPDCDLYLADFNNDGFVTAADIDPFVQALVAGG
jgi:sulfatase modifying factor 1